MSKNKYLFADNQEGKSKRRRAETSNVGSKITENGKATALSEKSSAGHMNTSMPAINNANNTILDVSDADIVEV